MTLRSSLGTFSLTHVIGVRRVNSSGELALCTNISAMQPKSTFFSVALKKISDLKINESIAVVYQDDTRREKTRNSC